jgi:hypothetical protein
MVISLPELSSYTHTHTHNHTHTHMPTLATLPRRRLTFETVSKEVFVFGGTEFELDEVPLLESGRWSIKWQDGENFSKVLHMVVLLTNFRGH